MLVPLSGKLSNEHAQKGLASLSRQEIAIPMDTVMTIQVLKTLITVSWGSPSTVEESISVASVNDSVVTEEVFTVRGLEDNADLDKGKFTYTAAETDANFENGKEYDYVDAGLGRESDLDSL